MKYPLTHNIRELLDLCVAQDATLDATLAPAVDLTQFAVRFCYPGEDQPNIDEAGQWLDLAWKTLEETRLRVPPETRD